MELIKKIKNKKELIGLPDFLVKEKLENYLGKNKIKLPLKEKDEKIVIKEVRSKLREYVGRFRVKSSSKKRMEFLEKEKISELLRTHSSTKERLDSESYLILKKIIAKIKPKSILDLACGLNPIALAQKNIKYYASDINMEDLNIVKLYFKKKKITGKVYVSDLTKEKIFPKTDLCLILKTLDILEKGNYKFAENLIKNIPCKDLIISFSTRTLSGKPMNRPERAWFERILEKINYKYDKTKTSNEIFYIIKK